MVSEKKAEVVWKQVDRTMLWAGCVRKGHKPVVVRCGRDNVMLYCKDCEIVWGVAMSSLSYIRASSWSGERLE